MIGIYKITNKITGKSYIGQSVCIEHRLKVHRNNAKTKSNRDYYNEFYTDLRELGEDNFQFDILEECSPEFLDEKEIYYIDKFDTYKNGYNRTCGGSGLDMTQVLKARELWDKGYSSKQITTELGLSRDTIRKYLQGYSNYNTNESHLRGFINSDDGRNKRKICQYTLEGNYIKTYFSCNEVERELGIWSQGISRCLNGQYFSSGGFRWAYEGEELSQQNKKSNLSLDKIANIKQMLASGEKRELIAKQNNVSVKTVSRINQGERHNDGLSYPIYDYKAKKSNR